MVFHQKQHPLHGAVRSGNIGRLAREPQLRASADRRNRKFVFQQTDVAVTIAKDRRSYLYAIQFNVLFCHVLLLKRPILMLLLYHQNII